MVVKTSESSAWQKRRSDFNHGWLLNTFYTGELERWLGFVNDTIEGGSFTPDVFESRIAQAWTSRGSEALALAREYEQAMSPNTFFEEGLLSRLDSGTTTWLRPLIVSIWKHKYRSDEMVKCVEKAFEHADAAFRDLRSSAHLLNSESVVREGVFRTRLVLFRERCRELGNAFHNLESSMKVT